MQNFNKELTSIVSSITENYEADEIFFTTEGFTFPNREHIIMIIKELRKLMFPGYFGTEYNTGATPDYFVGRSVLHLHDSLKKEVCAALSYFNQSCCEKKIADQSEEICTYFMKQLPSIQSMLLKDVQAAFDGDPAAHSKEEIILSYPGLFAIFVYRFAHELYVKNVPLIPRIMTEYAHSRTGIDINAGATIGEYFFMDHGTGIVIGETTTIGNNVKVYQGVTLGALSTRSGQQLSGVKRHPTIEDNVTIYSNSSILGGETIIGENSIIGGNAFIISSVPANTRVSVKTPELTFKGPKNNNSSASAWDI